MAERNTPKNKKVQSAELLPRYFRSDSNKKFLQATVDQLIQPGTVKKINGYIGRPNAKASTGADIFIDAPTAARQSYQLEPGLVIKDELDSTTFFKDYQDYINQIEVFGGNVKNHARINSQEFYSWDPHIEWDKFVNFQNYYWLPYGPDVIKVFGQQQDVVSTYTVKISTVLDDLVYVFSPDGATQNPSIKLFRGQTYRFEITSPGNPFSIKTKRVAGALDRYSTPGLVGVSVEHGIIEFTVPNDAPSVLYYVSETNIDIGGVFQIQTIDENTVLDIEASIIGKKTYTLPDGTSLSNGMKLSFVGDVSPTTYKVGQYYVEGVGDSIRLINESTLDLTSPYTQSLTVPFDSDPFDTLPFEDATSFAGKKDYIVINRGSDDHNPWSRHNRWFHKDVVEASAKYNNKVPNLDQNLRATRPIIEFEANLKLYNFGTTAIADVDLIDTYTQDVFSNIEGQLGYNVDGVDLAQGQRILFTADTDILVKNKIYKVDFLTLSGVRRIHLVEEPLPQKEQVVLINDGLENKGLMFWYDGTAWFSGQQKTTLNQHPLFDVVDSNGNSFSDKSVYDGSTFNGTQLFSYKQGAGRADSSLGFPLSYKNINNIGDIVFNFNLATDVFQFKTGSKISTERINKGYLVKTEGARTSYVNGWKTSTVVDSQAAVRIYKNSTKVNNFDIDMFDDIEQLIDLKVKVYVNGIFLSPKQWELQDGVEFKTVVLARDIKTTDILTIKAYASQAINDKGFYEVPISLQNNPLNSLIGDFTLGEVIDHVGSIVENLQGFEGSFPGVNNLRDLGNVTSHGTKFVQHSGPMSLAMYHMTSDTNNIIKSLEVARDDYNKFKRNFISVANNIGVDTDPVRYVNLILQEINKDRPKTAPYYFSDMVPYSGSVRSDLTVVDFRIKTYPMVGSFNLDSLSLKAVLVYLNNDQLLYKKDYTFNDQGFVVIEAPLANGDQITIYEYENTNGCYVPPTPTKLGLWPKFEPKMYLDTSLVTPRMMIQGHDGSQTLAYGDFRDGLILELEKRIYNTIKVEYDADIFDIDDVIPAFGRQTSYTLDEFNEVLATSFYKWTNLIDRDFTKPLSYDKNNSLTFNYRDLSAPDGRTPLPGYWKGVYRWMLGTDRPNICPWEILGFTEEPSWWQEVYGPAPYTRDNRVLWNDLADGLVREPGKPVVQRSKYVRPFLKDLIPVDEFGSVLSPLLAGLAVGTITNSTAGDFVFGDVSPVESAWRKSSYYPFSVLIAVTLLTPGKVFGTLLDRSRVVRNLAGQLIYKDTGVRVTPKDIVLPSIYSSSSTVLTSGIINYLVDYILSDSLKSYSAYSYNLKNIETRLSHRISSFSSKEKFNLLLDSKTPLSSGSVFIPQEDYELILNTSSPIKKITYSAVIITKLSDGFSIKGYSKAQPYFKYYPYVNNGLLINVGGISESFVEWLGGSQYAAGKIVQYAGNFYRSKAQHTTTGMFDPALYEFLRTLPIIGGKEAFIRTEWDRSEEITIPYGYKFRTIQEVVDFLLGYGEWLKDEGFIFDEFNSDLNAITNWETSAKEFLFWTTQNWSTGQDKWEEWKPNQPISIGSIVRYDGDYYRAIRTTEVSDIFNDDDFVKLDGLSSVGSAVISLSPAAARLTFKAPLSVVDDIRNPFNGYEIFKVDGTSIQPNFLNNYRDDTAVSYTPINDGIYGATFYLVQKEQVAVLKNTTLFNDTIYNPASGYRQERIKVSGYISNDWNGSFNIPGFIFDQANINDWQTWQDYALGDIVKYKQFYYTAETSIPGENTFDANKWIRLDKKPTPQLLPNWTYKAEQFTDFYSLDSDNFDADQQAVAQHLIGYQKRQYLSNIIKDDVSEFKFYQGMIVEKGTQNVLNKLFDVLSADGQESIKFYEEWALRVGQYGASSAFENVEFIIDEAEVKNNPQGYELVNIVDPTKVDFIVRQTPNDIYLKPIGYNNNPWPVADDNTNFLRTPGYVRPNEVKVTLKNLDDILTTSITDFLDGNYIWVGFEGRDWNVYRYTSLRVQVKDAVYSPKDQTLEITIDRNISLTSGSILGIDQTSSINGFYKVISVSQTKIIISAELENFRSPFAEVDRIVLSTFFLQRVTSSDNEVAIDRSDKVITPDRLDGELMWTDDAGDGKWATWKFQPVYELGELVNTAPRNGLAYGRRIILNNNGNIAVVSNSLGELVVYDKAGPFAPWLQRQTITPPFISKTENLPGLLEGNPTPPSLTGDVLAISTDSRWFASATPLASSVASRLKFINGSAEWSSTAAYLIGDIVIVDNVPYRAKVTTGNTNRDPLTQTAFWEEISYIPVDDTQAATKSSLSEQGVVSIYEKDKNNIFNLVATIVSPHPSNFERFGSSLAFGQDTLFVGSNGFQNDTGKVYRLSYLTLVKASTSYNPVGSAGTTLVLSNTDGILPNMYIDNVGFTSNQYVVQVVSATQIIISAPPDAEPSGTINFTVTTWMYDTSISTTERLPAGSNFGSAMAVSVDNSTLIVTAPGTSRSTYSQDRGGVTSTLLSVSDNTLYVDSIAGIEPNMTVIGKGFNPNLNPRVSVTEVDSKSIILTNSIIDDTGLLVAGQVVGGSIVPGMILTSPAGQGWISTGEYENYTVYVESKADLYTDVAQSSTSGAGTNARFNISKANGKYKVSIVPTIEVNEFGVQTSKPVTGSNYSVREVIKINGRSLGGLNGVNDLTITVLGVDFTGSNGVASISWKGNASSAFAYYDVLQTSRSVLSVGEGARFDVIKNYNTNAYDITVAPGGNGIGFLAGDQVIVSGTSLGGTSPANDLVVTVSTVTRSYTNISQNQTTGSGTGARFRVTRTGSSYTFVDVVVTGTGYVVNERLTVNGDQLGGINPSNNQLVIRVTEIGANGTIKKIAIDALTQSATGTGGLASISWSGTPEKRLWQTNSPVRLYGSLSERDNKNIVYTINGTTYEVILSAPSQQKASGVITFTKNIKGATVLKIADTSLLEVGDVVTISDTGSTLADTVVTSIVDSSHIAISNALTSDVTPSSQISFSRNIPGSVFVYKKNGNQYTQLQKIVGEEVDFGMGLTVSDSGNYIALSSVLSDSAKIDQGIVNIYSNNGVTSGTYQFYQELHNIDPEVSEFFGEKIYFMNDFQTLVVYSKGSDNSKLSSFDDSLTTFDNNLTKVVDTIEDSGRIDVYDRYNNKWIFSESLVNGEDIKAGYSTGLAVGANLILVGAPYGIDQGFNSGRVHEYRKRPGTLSWTPIHRASNRVDLSKIKKAFLYNKTTNKLVTYLDVVDVTQGKIPGVADQEIKYKTFYDPAVYFSGNSSVSVDEGMSWSKSQVGTLWWDLRNAKFFDSQDEDLVYRNSTWNSLFPGSSIDVYEWVESKLTPAKWNEIADTDEGTALGISGQSLYGNEVYGLVRKYDSVAGTFKNTYYFWVKNKRTIPNIPNRSMSANNVAELIANPRGYGYRYLALTGSNSFSLVNVKNLLEDKDIVLSVEYWTSPYIDRNIHSEWKIVSNNPTTNLPSAIEQKWFDSLSGKDIAGRLVPDVSLPPKLKYGIEVRPRQGMFINRFEALKQLFEQVNNVLIGELIVENIDISKLESFEKEPSTITGLYDDVKDTDAELRFANIGTYEKPILKAVIVDGRITGVEVVQRGRGYLVPPYFNISGKGIGAVVRAKINRRGQITGAEVISSGEGYDSFTTVTVRNYSVLVKSDSSAYDSWSIYSYEPSTQTWSRVQSQSYDVRKYWNYVDWYASGYNEFTAIDFSVNSFVELNAVESSIDQLVKVRNTNLGTWVLLRKYANSPSIDWTQSYQVVGREKGTLQFSSTLYEFADTQYGFDGSLYDSSIFDNSASVELRIILTALKENILVDRLKQEYLNLFFTSLRHVFTEQNYVDWAFKTSFVKATHSVGELTQKVTYNNDNLENFEDYINEVKPYRTKVREYVSSYEKLDQAQISTTDFDLPSVFENNQLSPVTVTVSNGLIQSDTNKINEYPWKHWFDNVGFSVVSIEIVDQGSGYVSPPTVRIVSNSGTGATARAFISNGRVNRIVLLTKGTGYLSAPTVIVDGGLSSTGTSAKAAAIIGDSVVRSNLIKIKFDRVSQKYYVTQLQETEEFGGSDVSGSRLQFPLTWAPDLRIGKSTVLINGVEALRANYKLAVVKSNSKGYTSYTGSITFDVAPPRNSLITVTYIKDWSMLTAADRIQYYYNPAVGELGKDLAQLMTGVDYGGVVVTGLEFDVGQGWGSSPYYTDRWDSFDQTFDDYIVTVSANTYNFTLPYVPPEGTLMNVYYSGRYTKTEQGNGISKIYNFDVSAVYPPTVTVSTIQAINDTSTTNLTGSDTITLLAVNNIKIGDVVTFEPNVEKTLGFNTRVVSINVNTNEVKLDQILFKDIVAGTNAVFTRTLVDPTDCQINPNGTVFLEETIPVGSSITMSAFFDPVRLDDPDYTIERTSALNDLQEKQLELTVLIDDYKNLLDQQTAIGLQLVDLNNQLSNKQNEFAALLIVLNGLTPSDPLYAPTVSQLNIVQGQIATLENSISQAEVNLTSIDQAIIDNQNNKVSKKAEIDQAQAVYDSYPPLQNTTAIMQTPVSDGIPDNPFGSPSKTFSIPSTFTVVDGDRFIWRKITSDGSLLPQDTDYDTAITGGDLTYATASGLAADDIIVDGDGFVTPTSSPATEEVVPGQVVDAVAIKVYDTPSTGSANIKVDSYIADGIQTEFIVSQQPNSPTAIIVKFSDGELDTVSEQLQSVSVIKTLGIDYEFNYQTRTVKFVTSPPAGVLVSIFSFGFNGADILDLDYFVGDGTQTEFITRAPWLEEINYLVYVNGMPAQPGTPSIFRTDESYDSSNRVGIFFSVPPSQGALINYIIVRGSQQTYSITQTEKIPATGALVYNLNYVVGDKLPIESNMIVRVDQDILSGPNNSYYTIQQNKLNYTIDPSKFLPYTLSTTDIVVLADGVLLKSGVDYVVEISGITIKINRRINKEYLKKELVISVRKNQGYLYIPPQGAEQPKIQFSQVYNAPATIEVISSYKHDILDIQSTAVAVTSNLTLTPDTTEYYNYRGLTNGQLQLDRPVLDDNYVWVIKNGKLLTPSAEFKLNDDKKSIQLAFYPDPSDEFTIMTFSGNVARSGVSYMQFKDMLNRFHFKRLNANKRTRLVKTLRFTDTVIEVEDASNFDLPSIVNNKPGVVEIRGERIEYFTLSTRVDDNNNTIYMLGQLRRGTLGTGVPGLHRMGSYVQYIGASETLPYNETTVVDQIKSDGTNIVPLTFAPMKAEIENGYSPVTPQKWKDSGLATGISDEFIQADDIEVFVGGYASSPWVSNISYPVDTIVEVGSYTYRCVVEHTSSNDFVADKDNWVFFVGNIRLKKKPYMVHDVNRHPESTNGDISLDAEFVVDGVNKQLVLTNKLAFGTRVTVIKKSGVDWDSTSNVLDGDTKISRFLKAAPGIWYSTLGKYDSTVDKPSTFDSNKGTFDSTSITFDQG